MNLNFFTILQNTQEIKIYDISSGTIPGTISSMELKVDCSKINNTPYTFDLISYLRSSRESDELFVLKANMLGLGETTVLPDGVYHMTYTINERYSKTHKFLVFQTIKSKIEQLLNDSEYLVDVGDYNITYVNDEINNKYDIEKVRFALTLYDKLLLYSQDPNEVEVNNLLDKLNRLLTIINNI